MDVTSQRLTRTLLDVQLGHIRSAPHPTHKSAYLAGLFTWDIFSNNHNVITPAGEEADIGSWRGAGTTIAELLAERPDVEEAYSYLDFYMGADYVDDLADEFRSTCYIAAFTELYRLNGDWVYSFPATGLVSFTQPSAPAAAQDYDPAAAQLAELERQQREEEVDRLRQLLADDLAQRKEEALYRPPPVVVQAYSEVFGRFPVGWLGLGRCSGFDQCL